MSIGDIVPLQSDLTSSFSSGASLRLDRESFGPVLRAGRQRRKVSLAQLCADTKVRPEVWMALEENDLSRWPRGVYARSLVRQYAERVDLDPEELVNEFCRLFPVGDRRRETLVREYAELVAAHALSPRAIGDGAPRRRNGDRPLGPESWAEFLRRRAQPLSVAGCDLGIVLAAANLLSAFTTLSLGTSIATVAVVYHTASVIATGRTAGAALVDLIRRRIGFAPGAFVRRTWLPASGSARD